MKSSPEKGGPCCVHGPDSPKLQLCSQNNSAAAIAQAILPSRDGLVRADALWRVWEKEAQRLFATFWRSGDLKHFHAFFRHVAAMRLHGGPRLSRKEQKP